MSTASIENENEQLRKPLADALRAAHLGLNSDELLHVVQSSLNARRSLAALAPAMARTELSLPSGIARGLQATENAWRRIESEFGLLSSMEASARIGSRSPNRTLANEQRKANRLLAVKRLNSYRFPGFQFQPQGGICPAIEPLAAMANELHWPSDEVVLWLCSPSGYFDDERPVDHLEDADFIDKARASASIAW